MQRGRDSARLPFSAVVLMALLIAFALPAEAANSGYRFDDLYGPSGHDPQWMILVGNNNSDTFGDAASQYYMDVSGDLVSDKNSVELVNGHPLRTETYYNSERFIHTMFLVYSASPAVLTVNFNAPDYYVDDNSASVAITPDTGVQGDSDFLSLYTVRKSAGDIPRGDPSRWKTYYSDAWKQFVFHIAKQKNQSVYESVRGNFAFHQNPSSAAYSIPSQTLLVPFVIANVYDGTAANAKTDGWRTSPVTIRATLYYKEYSDKNIVASRVIDNWFIDRNLPVGDDAEDEDQWVIVPVDSSNDPGQYYILIEVTNHTGVRYAVQRCDRNNWKDFAPAYWKFDIPYTQVNGDVPSKFQLDPLSHIAPGLVTVYNHKFDIGQSGSTKYARLRLYSVDPADNFYELQLYYRTIFATDLGSTSTLTSTNTSGYKVQAFKPRLEDEDTFKESVKSQMKTGVDVEFANVSISDANVTLDPSVGASTLSPINLSMKIPSKYQGEVSSAATDTTAGMLPVQVTFRIPSTAINDLNKNWDGLVEAWHNGTLYDAFKKALSVYVSCPAHDDKPDNPWDLIQELDSQTASGKYSRDMYKDQIKLAIDEKNKYMTVSFVTMLLDGMRDNVRPAMTFVSDTKSVTDNRYMIIRDGNADKYWDLTFYVAPAGYEGDNGGSGGGGGGASTETSGGGGGGGCSSFGLGALAAAVVAVAVTAWAHKREYK